MTKHTPGPWTICKDKGKDWEVNRLIGSKNENLGDLYVAPRKGEEGEYEANARLIAAAPELLEAMEVACKELHACQAVIHLAGGFDPAYVRDAQAALKAMRTAIAKATGEQPHD